MYKQVSDTQKCEAIYQNTENFVVNILILVIYVDIGY